METGKVKVSAFLVQFLASISIACLTTLTGFVYGWPSYTLKNFRSTDTILSHPMSSAEVSIFSSITNIGALLVTPFCGYAVNTYGRKYSAMLFGLPFVLSWAIISVTTSVPLVIAAVGLAGFGAAGQGVSSIYIAEITQDQIRGGLASSVVSGFFLGLLFSYFIGGQLTYYPVVYVHLTLSVVYILLLLLFKESPVFLLQKGKEEEAAKSIAFYRRVDVTSKEVEFEINKIKLQLDPRIEKVLQSGNDLNVTEELMNTKPEVKQTESSWKFLMRSESSKRALLCVMILMMANIMMGAIVLQVYAETLFEEAVPTMPPNLCSIFLAIDLLIPALISALTVDKFGRKFLMTSSSVASGVFTLLLAPQLQYHYAPHWFTAFLIYGFCFMYNLGAATVPFILPAEIFLPEVRGLCNSIVMGCMWVSNFVALIIFNPLVDWLGLGPLFYGFTTVCFITALYSQLCLPETKGMSADAIQLLFMKKPTKANRV